MTEEDKQNFSELPYDLRLVILKDFCYPNFLKKFSRYFLFRPYPSKGLNMRLGAQVDRNPTPERNSP